MLSYVPEIDSVVIELSERDFECSTFTYETEMCAAGILLSKKEEEFVTSVQIELESPKDVAAYLFAAELFLNESSTYESDSSLEKEYKDIEKEIGRVRDSLKDTRIAFPPHSSPEEDKEPKTLMRFEPLNKGLVFEIDLSETATKIGTLYVDIDDVEGPAGVSFLKTKGLTEQKVIMTFVSPPDVGLYLLCASSFVDSVSNMDTENKAYYEKIVTDLNELVRRLYDMKVHFPAYRQLNDLDD